MKQFRLGIAQRPLLTLGLAALIGVGLSACTSPEQRRHANLSQDSSTCADFGASPGSQAYTECMLAQQNRRDGKQREAMERAALATQMSKDSLEISRKVECAREAKKDREAGRRERYCP
ncbi:hypothetical protein [Paucibacter sp. M5-1]|uniref:hypothetical protein n=1 Tax=Paucibacter sp. M5-1 TaxID=3015998 RepID=UPI0022B8BA8C|nr:hypothetical protein [Paucibacter sp. M5-1]MCZ7880486.1 hypothetical protein [Paucibacter sp. M5-1]